MRRFSKEKYEELIRTTPLFDIKKEGNEVLYRTEYVKFQNLVTEYFSEFYPKKLEWGLEFSVTLQSCINAFDKTKGDFLPFFYTIVSRDVKVAYAKQAQEDNRSGIKISTRIKKLIRFAQQQGVDLDDEEKQKLICDKCNISIEELRDALKIEKKLQPTSGTVESKDGEKLDIYDTIADNQAAASDTIIAQEELTDKLTLFDKVFCSLQNRSTSNRLISMLLTMSILKEFGEEILGTIEGFVFCDSEIFEEFCQTGNLPLAKEIAARCGVSEQSASRTWNTFLQKLKGTKDE